jgi:transcription elongation factor Elf1
MNRFKDTREDIYSFQNEFLVRCPFCDSCAIVRCIDPDNADSFAPRRFSCTACGSSKDWSEHKIESWYSEVLDNYFHYPLWLQTSCCGDTLWAYNLRHLEFIEAFVRAKLRERKPHELYGWSNKSLFSRFPKWIQSGKNREEILKAIAKIRESVVTPT